MAQVTVSGKLRFAYETLESTTGTTVTNASGIRVTDGDLVFTATEDLGNGLRASANMAFQSRGRDTAIAGRDASVTLAGGFGSVLIGSIEAGNGIIGLGGAGASVYGMDGSVIAGAGNVDIIRYTTPALIPGLTASISMIDATATKFDATTAPNNNTEAAGGTLASGSAAAAQDARVIGINYSAGPLAVAADHTKYGNNAVTVAAARADVRTRISASYDLGVAKLGYGYQTADAFAATATTTTKTKDMIMGVNIPMGKLSLGLNYATSQAGTAVKVKGTDLGAKYDLSKRTFIAAHYQKVSNKDNASELGASGTRDAAAATNSNNKFRIQMSHSF